MITVNIIRTVVL